MTAHGVAAIVPAFDAEGTIGEVVRELLRLWPAEAGNGAVIVVDDGSSDSTSAVARESGARVVSHAVNLGKGAALRTGFAHALSLGFEMGVTVDADGQHFPDDAARLALHDASPDTLLLGVRDLARDGAPLPNRFSNGVSNFFLSWLSGLRLPDTQCGLRRYPLARTLALGGSANGYAYEAECLLRAARAGVPVTCVPVRVHYPEPHLRVTHFHTVRDPARIAFHVARTLVATRRRRGKGP